MSSPDFELRKNYVGTRRFQVSLYGTPVNINLRTFTFKATPILPGTPATFTKAMSIVDSPTGLLDVSFEIGNYSGSPSIGTLCDYNVELVDDLGNVYPDESYIMRVLPAAA